MLKLNIPQITLKVPLGQPTLNQQKAKLKLVKKIKKEPRKARFPWDIGLSLGNSMRCALVVGLYLLKQKAEI